MAWTRSSMVAPPAGLSARIASATYRRPTFAGRLAGFLAVFFPIPVRVAVGVAAVTGVAFLVTPQLAGNRPVVTAPLVALNSAKTSAKQAPLVSDHVSSPIASVVTKTVAPKRLAKHAVVVAPESTLPLAEDTNTADVATADIVTTAKRFAMVHPAIHAVPAASAHKAVLVAVVPHAKIDVAPAGGHSTESHHTLPKMNEGAGSRETEVAEAIVKPVESAKPESREPTATAPATVAVSVTNDPDAESNDGFLHLGRKLHNAGRVAEGELGGASAAVAMVAQTGGYIVSAPVK